MLAVGRSDAVMSSSCSAVQYNTTVCCYDLERGRLLPLDGLDVVRVEVGLLQQQAPQELAPLHQDLQSAPLHLHHIWAVMKVI